MKGQMLLVVGIMVLALGLVGTPATWANTLVVTDGTSTVNFTLDTIAANGTTCSATSVTCLTLTISSPTGITTNLNGWQGINQFPAFDLKNVGTGLTGLTLTGWTFVDQQLNANGCLGGNSNGFCFVKNPVPPTFNSGSGFTLPTFIINKTGGTFDLTGTGTNASHLQIIFSTSGTTCVTVGGCANGLKFGEVTQKQGSLLSADVPPGTTTTPEPTSLLLLGAGLAGIGIWRRKAIKA